MLYFIRRYWEAACVTFFIFFVASTSSSQSHDATVASFSFNSSDDGPKIPWGPHGTIWITPQRDWYLSAKAGTLWHLMATVLKSLRAV